MPTVNNGDAMIKYISCKNQNKYTILTNLTPQKDNKKESLSLLKPLFNLLNVNKIVFDYMYKLPAPNSFKYSFVDYYFKLYFLIENEIEDKDLKKELDDLLNEICSKYNKNINSIKNNEEIDIDNSLNFIELLFYKINNITYPEKVKLFQARLYYISGKNVKKTNLPCFEQVNYFTHLIERNSDEKMLTKDGYEIHCMLCIILYSEKEQDITMEFNPYFYSPMKIISKKDNHYFICCFDVDDNIKNNEEEINKIINFNNIEIKTEESKAVNIPIENNNQVPDDACAINCQACGTANILNEGNPEFKCVFCESPLF